MQGYWGNSDNTVFQSQRAHATFFGGEAAYKFFALRPVEVRPYVFLGPAFVTQVSSSSITSKTGFAVQPGLMALYHLGQGFAGVDSHVFTTPGPVSASLMLTGGAGF